MAAVERYKPLARWLHAIVAACACVLGLLGLAMTRGLFAFDATFQMYHWHKAIGVAVLVLMLVRVLARAIWPAPPMPAEIGGAHARAVRGVHRALYVVLLALPVSGWLMVSASPLAWPVVLPGIGELPLLSALEQLPDATKALWFRRLKTIHTGLAVLLGMLVLSHVAGALTHGATFRARMGLGRSDHDR